MKIKHKLKINNTFIFLMLFCIIILFVWNCPINSTSNNKSDNTSNKDSDNELLPSTFRRLSLVSKDHISTQIGNTISLKQFVNANNYNVVFYLKHKPAQSLATIDTGTQKNINIDAEGFYYIMLGYFSNGKSMGVDYIYIGTPSVFHYVREDAVGNNDGANWTDAWTELPLTLERGHTYFIAEGVYSTYECKTPNLEDKPIFIIKATIDYHGIDIGWNNSYGDGNEQATFESTNSTQPIIIRTDYWEFHGQTGEKDSGHGFCFHAANTSCENLILISDPTWSYKPRKNIVFKHCELAHKGSYKPDVGGSHALDVHSQAALQDSVIQYCYIHDVPGVMIKLANDSTNNLIDHNFMRRNYSDSVSHGEGIQTINNCDYNVVRYNIFEDIEGTAVIVVGNNWEIYGNIAYHTQDYRDGKTDQNSGGNSGFVVGGNGGNNKNNLVYNNTIFALIGANASVNYSGSDATGNITYNNIWIDCHRVCFFLFGSKVDYNYYYNNETLSTGEIGPNAQMGVENPFIDSAYFDFRLKAATDMGKQLSQMNMFDANGSVRGSDGVWDRGALEY